MKYFTFFLLLLVFPTLALAQAPTCQAQLDAVQSRLLVTQSMRADAEESLAQALTRIRQLQQELDAAKKPKAEEVTP